MWKSESRCKEIDFAEIRLKVLQGTFSREGSLLFVFQINNYVFIFACTSPVIEKISRSSKLAIRMYNSCQTGFDTFLAYSETITFYLGTMWSYFMKRQASSMLIKMIDVIEAASGYSCCCYLYFRTQCQPKQEHKIAMWKFSVFLRLLFWNDAWPLFRVLSWCWMILACLKNWRYEVLPT